MFEELTDFFVMYYDKKVKLSLKNKIQIHDNSLLKDDCRR